MGPKTVKKAQAEVRHFAEKVIEDAKIQVVDTARILAQDVMTQIGAVLD